MSLQRLDPEEVPAPGYLQNDNAVPCEDGVRGSEVAYDLCGREVRPNDPELEQGFAAVRCGVQDLSETGVILRHNAAAKIVTEDVIAQWHSLSVSRGA